MDYKNDVRDLLLHLEVNRSYIGYEYVIYGVNLVINDRNCANYITKSLYLDIAKEYNTSWQQVERNIRTVVEAVWRTDNMDLLKVVCGGKVMKKPNNKEFFLMLSDFVQSFYDLETAVSNERIEGISWLIRDGRAFCEYLKGKGCTKEEAKLVASIIIKYFN